MEILNKVKSFWVEFKWSDLDSSSKIRIFETVVSVIGAIAFIVMFFLDWRIATCFFFALWGNNVSQKP